MKTLLIYLKARLLGEKITWTDAKYRGLHTNTGVYLTRRFDATMQFGEHVKDAIKAFWRESLHATAYRAGTMKNWTYAVLTRYTLGRLCISIFNKEKFDFQFIFN